MRKDKKPSNGVLDIKPPPKRKKKSGSTNDPPLTNDPLLTNDPPLVTGPNEETRIRIYRAFDRFLKSHDRVYTFGDNMTNFDRALVHEKARKLGMISRSHGKGDQRHVTVYKQKKKSNNMEQKENHVITFSEESKRVLMDLFVHYPPGDDDVGKENFHEPTDNTPQSRGRGDDFFHRPVMNKGQIANIAKSFASKMKATPQLKQISVMRSRLPIASYQDVITSTVATHQVVLISGATGCGKTTQVPQYLLDYMWARGKACKIICTQPRRISATSVAERIAQERGEKIGDNVGYKIRLETKGGRQSSIVFCTNGIMLRVLVSGGSNGSQSGTSVITRKELSQITHIVVDEIHERDKYSDFMLAILRDLLPAYPHLRLVLMSATLDAERFSQYFGGSPIIRVPGFTHPVQAFYLEEILSILKSPNKNHLNVNECSLSADSCVALDEAIEMAISDDKFDPLLELMSSKGTSKVLNYQHSKTKVTPLMVFAGKGRVGDMFTLLSLGADCKLQAHDGSTALDWAKREDQTEAEGIIMKHLANNASSTKEEKRLVDEYMATSNYNFVDVKLVVKLLKKICMKSNDGGAILVFLPGWDDISKTQNTLLGDLFFKDPSKFLILSLHSMVPAAEQKKAFCRPPPGCRKIIISTNIAESSITIDDVVYVIDSGRMKEKSYDPYNKVSTLQTSWISKASAKQREGRAGRCQPGVCYHIFTKLRAVSLPEFQVPEMQRITIEELCLQVKMFHPNCKVEEFLNKTLDPPVTETINNAITVLQEIGALSLDERLTDLGEILGSLPVHPLTSKMLFFAILLNCLDPALTLACAADRDPFVLPMLPDEKTKAAAAKAELGSMYGGYSDQLAVVAAFDRWRIAKRRGQEYRFCSEYFISIGAMNMLDGMRKQLEKELISIGCIPNDVSSCSMNAKEPGIIRAVIVAGLYPMVGRLHAPLNGKKFTVETAGGEKVNLQSHSIISKLNIKPTDEPALLVYDEITRGDIGLMTRNCTIIGPVSLIILAADIVVVPGRDDGSGSDAAGVEDSDEGEMEGLDKLKNQGENAMSSPENVVTLIVDRWLSFELTALEVAQIYCLRERLFAAILFKVKYPREVLPPALGTSVYALACLLAYDGMTRVSVSKESAVDALTSMVHNTDISNSSAEKEEANHAPSNIPVSLIDHSTSSDAMLLEPAQLEPMTQDQCVTPADHGPRGGSHGPRGGSHGPRGGSSKRRRGNRSG